MRRLAVALLVVFWSATSEAQLPTHQTIAFKGTNGFLVDDLPATFDAHVGFPRQGIAEWVVEDLTTDDLGTWFRLDETTVASYGFADMAAVNAPFHQEPRGLDWFHLWLTDDQGNPFLGSPNAGKNLSGFSFFGNFVVESISFRVMASQASPAHVWRDWQMVIRVPEPATAVLLLLALGCCSLHRLRCRR